MHFHFLLAGYCTLVHSSLLSSLVVAYLRRKVELNVTEVGVGGDVEQTTLA